MSSASRKPMPRMVSTKCKCCGAEFKARASDIKRGWGKFCSKSCKALKQESKTGRYKKLLREKSSPQTVDLSLGECEMSWADDYFDKNED